MAELNELPQLRMILRLAELPAERALPNRFTLRQADGFDTEGIGLVLQEAFDDPWPCEGSNESC